MATICPRCEHPLKTGQRVRGEFVGLYREEPSGIHHGVAIEEELWLEHHFCVNVQDGD